MRTRRPMLVIASLLIASSCALLTRAYRPPLAPKSVAAKVKFPWGWPRERVTLTGVWLRAVTMAMDDFLPAEEAERARAEDAEAVCLARRDSYDAEAYVWAPEEAKDAGDARDGGEPEPDGGSNSEADAGPDYAITQPGMPKAPPVIYVSIFLIADCNPGGSPLMDVGATYAIDTVNWKILAIHH